MRRYAAALAAPLARPDFFDRLRARPGAVLNRALNAAGFALDALFDGLERYRQRQALHGMPEHLLKDMGLSRSDAEREAAKPFWKP